MKKIKNLSILLLVLISMVTLVGCFYLEPDTEITFVTLPKSTYTVGYDVAQAKADIVVQVKSSSGTFVMNLNSSELTVTGLDFSTAGQKTLTITYGTVSINYSYLVVDDSTSNQDEADISWYTANPDATTFRLYDVADMLGFAQIVNGTAKDENDQPIKDTFVGKTVLLMADIDLSETVWVPIGEGPREHKDVNQLYATPFASDYGEYEVNIGGFFMGTFDGQNNTITGLSDFGYVPAAGEYQSSGLGGMIRGATFGLFGRVSNATLKNIQFEDVNITGFAAYNTDTQTDLFAANDSVAALVGYSWLNIEVDNVHVNSGSIKAKTAAAGIVGRAYGGSAAAPVKSFDPDFVVKITNCSNAARIEVEAQHVAHLVGYSNVKVSKLDIQGSTGTAGKLFANGLPFRQTTSPNQGLGYYDLDDLVKTSKR
ncbi:MAG: Bacterial Ig-like domain (group 3) [Bacteroidetes bacterium ADurb.Bin302]|nr:MAG: Bacterial Ig-like domain (group 3) [Bacteroidetes bacterium ADurb.Bin302]